MEAEMTPVERGAVAAWRSFFGSEPPDLKRERGGVFDPNGWTWQVADAVVNDRPLPHVRPDAELVEAVRKAAA